MVGVEMVKLRVQFVTEMQGRGHVKFFAHLKEDEFDIGGVSSIYGGESTTAEKIRIPKAMPLSFVMLIWNLNGGVPIAFAGTEEAAAYGELISIGGLGLNVNGKLSSTIAEILQTKLYINSSCFYIMQKRHYMTNVFDTVSIWDVTSISVTENSRPFRISLESQPRSLKRRQEEVR
ncbi:hypothetical protein Fmac_011002 [Flemingia macrophylla]|uniref:L-dopachrome isomerase n=1 Tax=Flemingia macrophylla TaxID=520843 RepID=A0ABD1MLG5_9FABA